MTRWRLVVLVLALVLTGFAAAAAKLVDCAADRPQWSASVPPVNLRHVFCGEVNRRGRAVGYHALGGAREPGEARIAAVTAPPDANRVYAARICLEPEAPPSAAGPPLCKLSTLFPDDWSEAEVLAAILNAYRRGAVDGRGKWRGPSGRGFDIEGWLLPGEERINTAWPLRDGRASGFALE